MVDKSHVSITINISLVVMLILSSVACSGGNKAVGDAITERGSLPVLESRIVNTVITDSGIMRYRVKTPEWLVYDKKNPSYWAFEKGVYLETYDSLAHVESTIQCDTAYYYDRQKLWKLIGQVLIKNIRGEKISTNLLFWDQERKSVYSDEFIKIEQPDRIITGHGFESNQEMTDYIIHKVEGIFYVDNETLAADTTSAPPAN